MIPTQDALYTFSTRVQSLMTENSISQKELADRIHLTPSALNRYLRGNRMPNLELLLQLADFFQVSVSYLLGETEERHLVPPLLPDEKTVLEIYRSLPQIARDNFRINADIFAHFSRLCVHPFCENKKEHNTIRPTTVSCKPKKTDT